MEPFVSIVVPCYNAELFIEKTIKSIMSQTYQNWELYIIDDGSTDQSENIVLPFLGDNRITFLKNPKNSGVAFSRNIGIDKAKGRYLAFCDSDDIWEPTKLEKQINLLENSSSDICYTGYSLINENGLRISTISVSSSRTIQDELKSSSMLTSAFIYDLQRLGRHHFIQIGHEDYLFKLELMKKSENPAIAIPEALVQYRIVSNSLSHNKFTAASWQWNIYRKYLKFPLVKTIYHFIIYTVNGIRKHYGLS